MARRTSKMGTVPVPSKRAPAAPAGFPPPTRKPGEGTTAVGSVSKKYPAGKPLAWGNPVSVAYGHSKSVHGADRPAVNLKDRARSTGNPQGQWADNALIVEAEQRAPLGEGQHIVDMGRPIGTVHHPDGSETQTNLALVVRNEDGTLTTSFPWSPP